MMETRKAGPNPFGASIGISGSGGSGKTYSALVIAKAFVDQYGGEVETLFGMIEQQRAAALP